jgi:acyl carrier protein
MSISVREFVVKVLEAMNVDIAGVTDDTPIGEEGMGLESLAIAEVVMQVEEEYGIKYSDEDVEELPNATFGQFVADATGRIGQAESEAGRA